MNTHDGRVAVVTGAAVGFGRANSCELARRGADVIAVDLNPPDDTENAVQQLGRRALSLRADVSDPDQVAAIATDLLGFATRRHPRQQRWRVPTRDVFELEFAEWKRILEINLDSQFLIAKAVMGSMRENSWGRIVNLASNTLSRAVPNMVPYPTSKGAVVGFTRALATDLAPFGITVNAVCPTA